MAVAPLQTTGVQSVGSVGSVSKAFPGDVNQGSLLIAVGVTSTSDLLPGDLTDDRGNVWTRHGYIQRRDTTTAAEVIAIWSAVSKDQGPCTVTVDPEVNDYVSLAIVEMAGDWGPDRVNVGFTANTSAQLLTTAVATGAMVTTSPVTIVGCCTYADPTTTTITPDAAAGWIQVFEAEDAASMPVNVVYQNVPTGTYNPDWTLGVARPNTCAAVAFKEDPQKQPVPP